ncbi:MAG TPA: RNA polymerase sigma factor SigJ [Rhizomicrobium sp.]|jgi:RNA polymerase sigma-70 factor (ECF subfamily)|nr:RNA polymerase sigma factor SigJ [Rhizomicrobium sp.]
MPDTAVFERHRSHLLNIAYRMLGEMAAAEDVVQEAWLRWRRAGDEGIRDPKAWLSAATVRLSLDALRSARARREIYVGPWLPEPILPDDTRALAADGPAARAELASDLSLALLMVLERLSPEERAALILHDAFDSDYADIAAVLGKTEAACRKLVSRARDRVKAERPRHTATQDQHRALLERFLAAAATQDPAALVPLLKDDVILYSDGGGIVAAALNPIYGADKVARFTTGVIRKFGVGANFSAAPTELNGAPGFILRNGIELHSALTVEVDGDQISAIYLVRNPEKLRRIVV